MMLRGEALKRSNKSDRPPPDSCITVFTALHSRSHFRLTAQITDCPRRRGRNGFISYELCDMIYAILAAVISAGHPRPYLIHTKVIDDVNFIRKVEQTDKAG